MPPPDPHPGPHTNQRERELTLQAIAYEDHLEQLATNAGDAEAQWVLSRYLDTLTQLDTLLGNPGLHETREHVRRARDQLQGPHDPPHQPPPSTREPRSGRQARQERPCT